ncbi:MAG: DinB family protein [Nitrososphaerales archaeon]
MTTETKPRPQMDEVTLLRGWTLWNLKSLTDYQDAILRLTSEERKRDRGASWGSIQNIFLHILEDYIWWFEQVPIGGTDSSEDLVGRDFSDKELIGLVQRIHRSIHTIIDSLQSSDLGRPIEVRGVGGDGKPYKMTTCLADIMWHMVEEQLQHIGELNALFWQMDIDPPTHAWFSSEVSHTF